MPLTAPRWRRVTESQFPWEREALEFLAEHLPGQEPVRLWSNFEFVSNDGYVNEVDALVLTTKGLFLVEIKSRPARRVSGDAYTWTWGDGPSAVETDNPLIPTDRRAKRLASLLAPLERREGVRLPFIEALVFCSAAGLELSLPPNLATRVFTRDQRTADGVVTAPGIVEALTNPDVGPRRTDRPVDTALAQALLRMLDRGGVCRARSVRRVGGYKLGTRLGEGPLYEDFLATHPTLQVTRRVRVFPYPAGASLELRQTTRRAAEREFRALETITHPQLLKPREFVDEDLGPALIYDHNPEAVRLDHFVRRRHASLTLEARVHLVRQVAEALRFAHEHRRIHRTLSPQCILVTSPDADAPSVQITNWQGSGYAGEVTSSIPTVLGPTQHLSQLVEDAQAVYLAPEANQPGELTEAADVFSLGAVAYFVLTGQPPAATTLDLAERLRRGGLLLTDVLDAPDAALVDVVREATAGAIGRRTSSVDDVLAGLELWEEQVTRPDVPAPTPVDAHGGDELEGGFRVEKRLGKGATAVALQVRRGDERLVLKVALGPEYSERVRDEGLVLQRLHHPHIVGLREIREFDRLAALVLEHAGERTLARMLREDGRLSLEFLERFGGDLLSAVDYLERHGTWHRDLKPDNMGVVPFGKTDELRLVLYDFSLARVPVENVRAGTPGYLDPFLPLRKPVRYDLHAERFAAAVTLYEMATGHLPAWGDGSDPAQLDCEATIDAAAFDVSIRDRLTAFFSRALARDAARRFDNAEDMASAWRQVFAAPDLVARPTVVDVPGAPELDPAIVEAATLDASIDQLGLSARAVNALQRLGCSTLRDMLCTPVAQVVAMRGVGNKTRRELSHAFDAYRERFADADLSAAAPATEHDEGRASVDAMFARLLVAKERDAGAGKVADVLGQLLGTVGPSLSLPSQTEVAERVGVSRAYVSLLLQKPRNRWGKDAALTALRRDLAELLGAAGGVMGPGELVTALLERRGSAESGERRVRHAGAVLRAALEAEAALKEPRFAIHRRGARALVATAPELAAYALALGEVANDLSAEPLPPPLARALDRLRAVASPLDVPLDDTRLIRLAALASTAAAVSSRLELYPRGLPALRAAKLANNMAPAVSAAGQWEVLTADEVRRRVSSRFPDAEPLPDRPALDTLLDEADWNVEWDASGLDGRGGYRSRVRPRLATSSVTLSFQPTAFVARVADDDEAAAARRFDERLKAAVAHGGFLALTVPAKYLRRAERELQRQYGVRALSVERALLDAMKATAGARRIKWDVVARADGASRDTRDWQKLCELVQLSLPGVAAELPRSGPPALLTSAGMLARYGHMRWLSDLTLQCGRADGLHGAWLLVPWEDPGQPPTIDGEALPVLASQRAHVPDGWLKNRHRAGAA